MTIPTVKEFLHSDIIKTIKLPTDEREEFVAELMEVLVERLIVRIMNELRVVAPEQQQQLQKMLNNDADVDAVIEFAQNSVPNLPEVIDQERHAFEDSVKQLLEE